MPKLFDSKYNHNKEKEFGSIAIQTYGNMVEDLMTFLNEGGWKKYPKDKDEEIEWIRDILKKIAIKIIEENL